MADNSEVSANVAESENHTSSIPSVQATTSGVMSRPVIIDASQLNNLTHNPLIAFFVPVSNIPDGGPANLVVSGEPRYFIYAASNTISNTNPNSSTNGNTPPVAAFIQDCKFAEQSVYPGDRAFLAKLIRTRVKGDANAYLQNLNEPVDF